MAYSTAMSRSVIEDFRSLMRAGGVILIYDLETTGLNPQYDRPVQLAVRACMVVGTDITTIGSWVFYIKLPDYDAMMSPGAFKLHGISKKDLEDKPLEGEVFEEIRTLFGTYPVCGYNNTGFDDKFMDAMFKRNGAEFNPSKSYDAFPVTRIFVPASEVDNHKLGEIAKHFGFEDQIAQFHDARGDALATELILGRLLQIINEQKETEPSYADLPKVNVTSVAYWKGVDNVRPRIYVDGRSDGKMVKFWIDPVSGEYHNASKNGLSASGYDIDDLERQVLGRIKCGYKDYKGG